MHTVKQEGALCHTCKCMHFSISPLRVSVLDLPVPTVSDEAVCCSCVIVLQLFMLLYYPKQTCHTQLASLRWSIKLRIHVPIRGVIFKFFL